MRRRRVGVSPEALHAVLLVRCRSAGLDVDVVRSRKRCAPRTHGCSGCGRRCSMSSVPPARTMSCPVASSVTISVCAASMRAEAYHGLWIRRRLQRPSRTRPDGPCACAARAVSVNASSAPVPCRRSAETRAVGPTSDISKRAWALPGMSGRAPCRRRLLRSAARGAAAKIGSTVIATVFEPVPC